MVGSLCFGDNCRLEGLLIFLLADKGSININTVIRSDRQFSYVIPITQIDFIRWLARIQSQSNMIVKQSDPEMVVSKIADEGTTNPFFARLLAGMLKIRDNALTSPSDKAVFDKNYDRIIKGLMNMRITVQAVRTLFGDHCLLVTQGVDTKLRGNTIQVERNIDIQLANEVNDFINNAVRVVKTDMQELTKLLGLDIGFLFQAAARFSTGIGKLQQTDAALAAYLQATRQWSEPLLGLRNSIEHSGWRLPGIKYQKLAGTVRAEEPAILPTGHGIRCLYIRPPVCPRRRPDCLLSTRTNAALSLSPGNRKGRSSPRNPREVSRRSQIKFESSVEDRVSNCKICGRIARAVSVLTHY